MTGMVARLMTVLLCILFFSGSGFGAELSDNFDRVPVQGRVTMIDLGAKKCIPCKMMAPILEKMDRVYQGMADIAFIDVWKHGEQARRFQVKAIPTQIFFDANGKEVYRHVGFLGEKDIIARFAMMGVILTLPDKRHGR